MAGKTSFAYRLLAGKREGGRILEVKQVAVIERLFKDFKKLNKFRYISESEGFRNVCK